MALVPLKLLEIQEKRCKSIQFAQLPMLYPINSTVYTYEDSNLCAFVIAELFGMDARPFGTYAPLQIRAWSIDHNGNYFVKRYHDLVVSQFPGERDFIDLKYIPAGYLPDELNRHMKLIERGQLYLKLGADIHFMQCMIEKVILILFFEKHLC
jgi:hypothetical protein